MSSSNGSLCGHSNVLHAFHHARYSASVGLDGMDFSSTPVAYITASAHITKKPVLLFIFGFVYAPQLARKIALSWLFVSEFIFIPNSFVISN